MQKASENVTLLKKAASPACFETVSLYATRNTPDLTGKSQVRNPQAPAHQLTGTADDSWLHTRSTTHPMGRDTRRPARMKLSQFITIKEQYPFPSQDHVRARTHDRRHGTASGHQALCPVITMTDRKEGRCTDQYLRWPPALCLHPLSPHPPMRRRSHRAPRHPAAVHEVMEWRGV